MPEWILPTLGALLFWGFWGFIPKITTEYISPQSAIIYEVLGAILIGAIALFLLKFRLEVHPQGIALAITTGMLGFLGAFCFLTAVSKGPVTLVATVSALYPIVSIILANLVLHETITLKQGVGIALALLSTLLVAT
jgi:transporter family protein